MTRFFIKIILSQISLAGPMMSDSRRLEKLASRVFSEEAEQLCCEALPFFFTKRALLHKIRLAGRGVVCRRQSAKHRGDSRATEGPLKERGYASKK